MKKKDEPTSARFSVKSKGRQAVRLVSSKPTNLTGNDDFPFFNLKASRTRRETTQRDGSHASLSFYPSRSIGQMCVCELSPSPRQTFEKRLFVVGKEKMVFVEARRGTVSA